MGVGDLLIIQQSKGIRKGRGGGWRLREKEGRKGKGGRWEGGKVGVLGDKSEASLYKWVRRDMV